MIFNLKNKKTGETARAVKVSGDIDSLKELYKVTKAFEVLIELDCVQIRGGQGESLKKVSFGDWVVRDNCKNVVLSQDQLDIDYGK